MASVTFEENQTFASKRSASNLFVCSNFSSTWWRCFSWRWTRSVFGFLLEGADLLVELCDPDGVEGGHCHGCDRDADGDESFGSAWH